MKNDYWFNKVQNEEYGIWSTEIVPQVMSQAHRHDEVELNYVSKGFIAYEWGGEIETIEAGHLSLFWAAFPHQVVAADPDSRVFVFTMPIAQTLQWRLPQHFEQRLLSGQLLIDINPLATDEDQCRIWDRSIKSAEPEEVETTQIEIYARLRRMSAHLVDEPLDIIKGASSQLQKVERPVQVMSQYIALHCSEAITVADVAQAADVHPAYAMNLFRRTVGRTIGEYINQHRLFHARRLLLTSNLKVLDIAFDCGFGSASRFYESFAVAFNETPGQFRSRSGWTGRS